MEELIFYIITLVVMFTLYYTFVVRNKKRLQKFSDNMYVNYLVGVYKLDKNKIDIKQLAIAICMINSFIIATIVFILGFINHLVLKFVLGFICLLPLQLLMYHIVGKIFQKKFRRDK